MIALPVWLAACAGGNDGPMSFSNGREQPYPTNYRADLLAFFRAYLNNPIGVRDAAMADPVQRTVGGRVRYISCVRYTPRDSDGSTRAPQERAVMYVDGRLDRVIDNATDTCAGATYVAFPELEKMAR